MHRTLVPALLGCALLALPHPAAADAVNPPVDLQEQLQVAAQKRLFFDVPDPPVRYRVDDVEYWGTGFELAGLGESFPAERWAVFELSGLAAGRTRVAAVMERSPSVEELLAFLEDGDVLTLTLTYKDRLEYTWTDVVLGQDELRELVLFEVETLSYALPRVEGYSTLWYDRRTPDRSFDRTHLSQDVLSRIATRVEPGAALELALAPGGIAVLFFPEIEARTLPVALATSYEGKLVFGVLSGRMGFLHAETGACPAADEEGQRVLELTLPGDLAGRCVLLRRNQSSMAYFVLHVPQDAAGALTGKLAVGEPVQPASGPPAEETPE